MDLNFKYWWIILRGNINIYTQYIYLWTKLFINRYSSLYNLHILLYNNINSYLIKMKILEIYIPNWNIEIYK